jgi:hypothetical protein
MPLGPMPLAPDVIADDVNPAPELGVLVNDAPVFEPGGFVPSTIGKNPWTARGDGPGDGVPFIARLAGDGIPLSDTVNLDRSN